MMGKENDNDMRIFIGGEDNYFYAITPKSGYANPLAPSGWPCFRHDLQNSGRKNTPGTTEYLFGSSGSGVSGQVNALTQEVNGKIIIAGSFSQVNGTSFTNIARLNYDGTSDSNFQQPSGISGYINAIALTTDANNNEKILIAGSSGLINASGVYNYIARLNTNGAVDFNFHAVTLNGDINSMGIQSTGKIIIGGNFTSVNGYTYNRVARLNSDGTIDTTFLDPGFNAQVYSITVFPSSPSASQDYILVGGVFSYAGSTGRNCVARLTSSGSLDLSFYPINGVNSTVYSGAILSDGSALIAGGFSSSGSLNVGRVAHLLASTGSLDTTFNSNLGTGANNSVYSVVSRAGDGAVTIGGSFTSVNGTTGINRIYRLKSSGGIDTRFQPGTGANSTVYALGVDYEYKIILGGAFTSMEGLSRSGVARLSDE